MRRVYALIALLMLALTTCFGVGSYRTRLSQKVTNSFRAAAIPNTCALPCWFGITPGSTLMTEAARLLLLDPHIDRASIQPASQTSTAFALQWREPSAWLHPAPFGPLSNQILILPLERSEFVGEIVLMMTLPLGDFVLSYGAPAQVRYGKITTSAMVYILEYPTLGMSYIAYTSCRPAQNLANVRGTQVILRSPQTYRPLAGYATNVDFRWRGLTSWNLDLYLQRETDCQ